jgi:predicted branched-subunit amino acid permease
MSAIVFAGSAQFIAAQLIGEATAGIVVVATIFVVNLRHALYSASLAPYVRHLNGGWKALLAYLLTDEAYAVAILRYQTTAAAGATTAAEARAMVEPSTTPDLRHWYFLGCGFTLWLTWQLSTAAGLLFGATIPPEWEIDFAVPLTFIALLTLLLRERAGQAAALVAGLGALAFATLPYKLGLVAAILLGLLAGVWGSKHGGERTR